MDSPLFEKASQELAQRSAPLAERVRPKLLEHFVGQDHLVAPGKPLRRAIDSDELTSMIFWGPPGSGKTTLARIIAETTKARFVSFSAVTSGIKQAREIIAKARDRLLATNRRTILFVDEIHRFNKAQQDAFLPHVEDGTILLIGATTENPSFEINAALLSRSRVFVLNQLDDPALVEILRQALADTNQFAERTVEAEEEALQLLAGSAGGDARSALSNLEWVVACLPEGGDLTAAHTHEALPHKTLLYDKKGEEHYNLISALQKSVRGSDPQATLYWLARMLLSGEDPMYIARRLVRMASEDIGLADPQALGLTVAARDSYHMLGSPEGELALAQAAVYLATAPKSNSIDTAYAAARKAAEEHGPLPVPPALRNASTRLMKEQGYGKGYVYDHDAEHGFGANEALPEKLPVREFYRPGSYGFEREIAKRMDWWQELRSSRDKKSPE